MYGVRQGQRGHGIQTAAAIHTDRDRRLQASRLERLLPPSCPPHPPLPRTGHLVDTHLSSAEHSSSTATLTRTQSSDTNLASRPITSSHPPWLLGRSKRDGILLAKCSCSNASSLYAIPNPMSPYTFLLRCKCRPLEGRIDRFRGLRGVLLLSQAAPACSAQAAYSNGKSHGFGCRRKGIARVQCVSTRGVFVFGIVVVPFPL